MLKNKIEPTPWNLIRVTKELAEKQVPSDETVDLMHDRMNYTPPDDSALCSRLADAVALADNTAAPLQEQIMDSNSSPSNSSKPSPEHWTPEQLAHGDRFRSRLSQAKAAYQKRAEQQSTSLATRPKLRRTKRSFAG